MKHTSSICFSDSGAYGSEFKIAGDAVDTYPLVIVICVCILGLRQLLAGLEEKVFL